MLLMTVSSYTNRKILETETHIAVTLNFNLVFPSPYTFLCRYLSAAHADLQIKELASFVTERMLQEYTMIKYLPSVIAASAVRIARVSLHKDPWSPTLAKYTHYDEADIKSCVSDILVLINDTTSLQTAVFRKYSEPKHESVAKLRICG